MEKDEEVTHSNSDYIVTIKLPNNPNHNPRQKIPGECPAFGGYCTDVTGAHHSTILRDWPGAQSARSRYEAMGFHVTRVERISKA